MDFTPKKSVNNPYVSANPLSKLFFAWVIPFFRIGSKKDLEVDDLYDVLSEDASGTLGDLLEKNWKREIASAKLKGKKPKLISALFKTFGKSFLIVGFVLILDEWVIRIAQPLFIRYLVKSFSDNSTISSRDQYLLAVGVSVSALLHTFFIHPTMYYLMHLAMKCRITLSSIIYRKTLRLSKATTVQTTMGQITNLLGNDVNRFDRTLVFIHYLYLGPIQLGIFTYFLWEEFGVSTFAGLAFIILVIPFQYWNGKYTTNFRINIAKKTDERGRIMSEIILAIRVIKMYAWEKPFGTMIAQVRKLEINFIRKISYLRGIYLSMNVAALKLIPFLIIITYYFTDNELTSEKVFFVVAVVNTITQTMIYMVPSGASGIAEIMVSVNRIETFMLLEEKGSDEKYFQKNQGQQENASIKMSGANASWTNDKLALDNIDLDVSGNQLVIVVGPVGSGKTSLLHALLSELPISGGKCITNRTTCYASQEPWIFTGNVKQNILFGSHYDEKKYQEVVRVCALLDDFKQLDYGDLTIVGERGVSLSGGQKARVNLARALYQEADIYYIDDALSAVDSRVSRYMFENCFKKYLNGRLRILVTHQLQYLPQADHVVVFNEGKILAQGTYTEMVEKGIDFVSLMTADEEGATRKESVVKQPEEKKLQVTQNNPGKAKEAEKEKMSVGSISLKIYGSYFGAGKSPFRLFFLVTFFIITQLAISGSELWLSLWTNAEEKGHEHSDYLGEEIYIGVYGGLVGAVVILALLRAFSFFSYCMRISQNIHNKMFQSLSRAPTKFFDDNPSGRVMNRFTKDTNQMDEQLPPTFFDFLMIFLTMFGVMIVVIISNYYLAIPEVFIFVLLYLIRQFYAKTARDVKRLEGITRSPVFTHTAATYQGLVTIRSSGEKSVERLAENFDAIQDIHSSSWFLFIATARCFGIWIEMIAVLFLAIVTFSFLVLGDSMSGNVGLAISSTMSLTGWFQYGMRQSTETENLMTSVERALEYTNLESEAALESKPDKNPPTNWPSGGEILFQSVSLAYDDKKVLKNLSFEIKSEEKIGIVGRTGAGKSSIITALFRMTEPQGNIFIDGIKINEIGLHDLRKNISIIPQDPVLFSGTVRYNLDPFNQYPDDNLWQALEEVELKEAVPSLDFIVSDSGSNFSVGQRQLVCLARAILRKNKIIVMDEATANVDPRTDNFIQKTIRQKFADCTIITIAHRLHSVIDCDKILVLDNGYLKEYDHPHILLQETGGILSSMVSHTGKASAFMLRKIAADTFEGSRKSFNEIISQELASLHNEEIEDEQD